MVIEEEPRQRPVLLVVRVVYWGQRDRFLSLASHRRAMPTIVVEPYDPDWPLLFEQLYARVWPAVQHASIALEHVGSTAVPGLAAKPIIDACIVLPSPRDLPFVTKGLVALGYVHRGNLGVPGRDAFKATPDTLPKHHLYASHRGSVSLKNHLGLRDYLRANPDAAREYGALKQSLAAQFPDDIDRYIAGKTPFVLDVLRRVGLNEAELAEIAECNRL
jgi:GrpB-like predicted nucleotidyltransferase (UPF0157 family)